MIFNIECCGGGQWRFLWCIIMRLPKKVKDLWWGVRLKMIYFLVSCGNRMGQKSSGIWVIETKKPEIGLAPISLNFIKKSNIRYQLILPASSARRWFIFTFSSFPILTRSADNSSLAPLFNPALRIVYLCVFVLPFDTSPTFAGPQRIWATQYCSSNLVSKVLIHIPCSDSS